MSKASISQHDRNVNSLVSSFSADDLQILEYLTVEDLKQDIHRLEDQIEIAKDELSDYEEGHKERPYRTEFMAKMRQSYRSSLRELRSHIAKTHALIRAKEALSASAQL